MLIEVALNGKRTEQVPATPAEIVGEARDAIAAGARAIHVHVRDAAGRESLAAADVALTVRALREACPGVPLGVSTGAWIVPDLARRLELLEGWELVPDFASVNMDEAGAPAIVDLLLAKGVGIEAGIASPAAAEVLVRSGRGGACLRVLLEPGEPSLAAARANASAIERLLDAAAIGVPRLLHGDDATAWPLLEDAIARGIDTRIGLEDTLLLPDGAPASSNAALVAAAFALLDRQRAMDRR